MVKGPDMFLKHRAFIFVKNIKSYDSGNFQWRFIYCKILQKSRLYGLSLRSFIGFFLTLFVIPYKCTFSVFNFRFYWCAAMLFSNYLSNVIFSKPYYSLCSVCDTLTSFLLFLFYLFLNLFTNFVGMNSSDSHHNVLISSVRLIYTVDLEATFTYVENSYWSSSKYFSHWKFHLKCRS